MQNAPVLVLMEREVRAVVCVQCYLRPEGSEAWGPMQERPCESACPIFQNLPQLAGIAKAAPSREAGFEEKAMLERVCQHCTQTETSGDFCADRVDRACPLSRYAFDVLDALSKVMARHHAV